MFSCCCQLRLQLGSLPCPKLSTSVCFGLAKDILLPHNCFCWLSHTELPHEGNTTLLGLEKAHRPFCYFCSLFGYSKLQSVPVCMLTAHAALTQNTRSWHLPTALSTRLSCYVIPCLTLDKFWPDMNFFQTGC